MKQSGGGGPGGRPTPKEWGFLNVTETGDDKAFAVQWGICYYDRNQPDPVSPCDGELHKDECQVFGAYALTGSSPSDPTSGSACVDEGGLYKTKYEVVPGGTLAGLMSGPPSGSALLVQCGASPVRDGPCGAQYQLQQTGKCQAWGNHAPGKYGGSVRATCTDDGDGGGGGLEVAQFFGAACSGAGPPVVTYSANKSQSCATPPTEQYQDFNGYVGACRK